MTSSSTGGLCWPTPATGDRLRARWDWVLVDEYQDVNRIQVDIVRLLRPDGSGLTVVGDDAQAIYSFRGADAAHLLDLHAQLPGSRLVRLERNYRSTQEILDVANLVRPGELELTLVADRDDRVGRPVVVSCDSADAEARSGGGRGPGRPSRRALCCATRRCSCGPAATAISSRSS